MASQTTRLCPLCKITKPNNSFRRRSGPTAVAEGRHGRPYGYCIPCENLRRSGKPDRYFSNSIQGIRHRTKNKNIEVNVTRDYLVSLAKAQDFKCVLSGRQLTFEAGKGWVASNASVDRIAPWGGYTIGNVRIVCNKANTMRGAESDEEFLQWCIDVANHLGRPD